MNTCVCCGNIIPEGRQVCPNCETWSFAPDVILADGTRLYFKTSRFGEKNPGGENLQLELYQQLMDYKRALNKED